MTTLVPPIVDPAVKTATAENVPEFYRLGPSFVPKSRYIDPEFLALEYEKLFTKTWLNACRLEEIEQVGDYVEYTIGDQSIIVVRTRQDEVKAFHNACRHRGTALVRGKGRVGEFRCGFHAWRWNLDGSLKYMADAENFEPRPAVELCLPECQVGTWGGWVFINMDKDAEPLLDFLDPLPTRFAGFKLEEQRFLWYKTAVVPANWKTAMDAFIESWHVPGTHPQLLRDDQRPNPSTIAEAENATKYFNELFRYHSRHSDVRLLESGDGYRPMNQSLEMGLDGAQQQRAVFNRVQYGFRELRALTTATDVLAAAEMLANELQPGVPAYVAYENLRAKHARAAGVDFPDVSAEQMKGAMHDWHLFPNTVFLPSRGCTLVYRSRPNGMDPDSCIFDTWSMQLFPEGMAPQVEQEFYENWEEGDMGGILNQDFGNMGMVTKGLHSREFDGYRLNMQQEMTIHNYHRAIDSFLFA